MAATADLIHFEVVVFSETPDESWAKTHAKCIYKKEMKVYYDA